MEISDITEDRSASTADRLCIAVADNDPKLHDSHRGCSMARTIAASLQRKWSNTAGRSPRQTQPEIAVALTPKS
jgi:hypothetical protein